ncbi:MAG: ABC transporter substrate-binding protein, partial [Aestuariivirgaceae bacterium]
GQIDVSGATIDSILPHFDPEQPYACVMMTDESLGADGILATRDIKTIADLKGKNVAVNEGSVSDFYLNVLLQREGLKASDVNVVNMTASDAGAAFVSKQVDAAVTWEPWLSRGKTAEHGHLLVDSSTTPGLITDVIIVKKSWLADHTKETAAIVKSWNEAIAYYREHPDESIEIMAKGVGGWLKDPKEFKATLTGIKFYGAEDNKAFFGTKDKPGPLSQTVAEAIKIWSGHGRLQVETSPDKLIDYSFVNQ